MITLDETLATAQDSASRHPLVEIISSPKVADIPFAGLDLSATSASETEPFALTLEQWNRRSYPYFRHTY